MVRRGATDPDLLMDRDLTKTVLSSFDDMPWLTPADEGAKKLALTYAASIDEAIEHGRHEDITKALYLGPHLLKVLESLGGTPAGRGSPAKSSEKKGPSGKLAHLRAVHSAKPA